MYMYLLLELLDLTPQVKSSPTLSRTHHNPTRILAAYLYLPYYPTATYSFYPSPPPGTAPCRVVAVNLLQAAVL